MDEYVITDGSRFIYKNHRGQYVPTSCEAMADKYSYRQANGIRKNSLNRALKSAFYLEKYEPFTEEKQGVPVRENQFSLPEDDQSVRDGNIHYWIEKMSQLNGLRDEAMERQQQLKTQLKRINMEICDIEHYVEFYNLNACQGYKAYKMLKDRRIERRVVKDELFVLETILNKKISDSITEELDSVQNSIENRKYTPRYLSELFDT